MLLESALTAAGVTPNQACTYNFAFTDVCVRPVDAAFLADFVV